MTKLFSPDAIGVANIWAEARSEPLEGKIGVAEVTLNRMKLGYFSDGTVAGTVFRPWQFSWANTDNKWRSKVFELDWESESVKECKKAWDFAKGGSKTVGNAVLYHTIQKPKAAKVWPPPWAKAEGVVVVKTINQHIFYEDRG